MIIIKFELLKEKALAKLILNFLPLSCKCVTYCDDNLIAAKVLSTRNCVFIARFSRNS